MGLPLPANDVQRSMGMRRTFIQVHLEGDAYLKMTICHNGMILLQGNDFQAWGKEVFPAIKQLLDKEENCDTENCCTNVHVKCTSKDSTSNKAEKITQQNTTVKGAEYSTPVLEGQNGAVTSTPTKNSASTVRTQLLYSLSPQSSGIAQQDLLETEERSLTSLLNGALEDKYCELTEMPSMSGMRDDSFNMLTLVRPSLIPEDIEQSPSEQIKELQRTVLRANNKITELETEKKKPDRDKQRPAYSTQCYLEPVKGNGKSG